jgi:hypothetical protein
MRDCTARSPLCHGCLRLKKYTLKEKSPLFRLVDMRINPIFNTVRDSLLTEQEREDARRFARDSGRAVPDGGVKRPVPSVTKANVRCGAASGLRDRVEHGIETVPLPVPTLRGRGRIRPNLLAAAALLGTGMLQPLAFAGPPFVTDDPEPVEKAHGEFYVATQDVWNDDGGSGTLPHFELNYGPVQNVQLHVLAPLAWNRPAEGGAMEYGYGDTEIGVKWRFIQEDTLFKGCPQVGTFPLVELRTGSTPRGLGEGETRAVIPIWLQKSWGQAGREWTTYGGGGYWFNPGDGNKNYWFTGWEIRRQVTQGLAIGGEVYHTTSAKVGPPAQTAFNLGGILDVSEQWHLLFSAGRDFQGPNRLTLYLAMQLTF